MKEVNTWLETLWSESTAVACPVLHGKSGSETIWLEFTAGINYWHCYWYWYNLL